MQWNTSSLRSSMSALLGSSKQDHVPETLEAVRQAMLATLGSEGAKLNPLLQHRLEHLQDAHALWFARAEVMAVLSGLHGEESAVNAVRALSPMFSGLIPRSLMEAGRKRRRCESPSLNPKK